MEGLWLGRMEDLIDTYVILYELYGTPQYPAPLSL